MPSSSQNWRLLLATALAVLGLFLGVRAWLRSTGSVSRPIPSAPIETPKRLEAQRRLDRLQLDTRPTQETVQGVLAQAASAVEQAADAVRLGGERIPNARDLADAFRERLSAVIDPEMTRDSAARANRGSSADPPPESEKERREWEAQAELFRYSAIGLSQLEVRAVYSRGKRTAPKGQEEGFETITSTLIGAKRFDIAEDPEAGKLDVIEVRLPMEVARVGSPAGAKTLALVGFEFGWNTKRRQWIPMCATIYSCDGEAYYAMRFR